MPQAPAVHVAWPFASVAHGVHDDVPHDAVEVLLTHELPQRWYPLLHVRPQLVPLHVATPFGSVGHAEQDEVPHEAVELLLAQVPLQRW
jgi:hypothetical protein